MTITLEPPDCIAWAAILLPMSCIGMLPDRLADAGAHIHVARCHNHFMGLPGSVVLQSMTCGACPD